LDFWADFSGLQQGAVYADVPFEAHDGESSYAVVVTPRCDFANDKVDYVTILPAAPAHEVLLHWVEIGVFQDVQLEHVIGEMPISQSKYNQFDRQFRQNYLRWHQRDAAARFHFLPQSDVSPACVVDFQASHSMQLKQFAKFRGAKSIKSPYIEHLLARFASWVGRVGVEGFTTQAEDDIIRSLTSFAIDKKK
jgi:hypothetical protein